MFWFGFDIVPSSGPRRRETTERIEWKKTPIRLELTVGENDRWSFHRHQGGRAR